MWDAMIHIRKRSILMFLIQMMNRDKFHSIIKIDNSRMSKSRFCYNYTPPGTIDTYCKPVASASSTYISSISCLSNVVNNNMQTTQGSLLQAIQQQYAMCAQSTMTGCSIQNTVSNTSSITSTLQSQLQQLAQQRYLPYQPYVPIMMPSSVIQLQMATANVGTPMVPITCLTGKGVQYVTN